MLALVVTVPAADVELASDALWNLGVVAIEERMSDERDVAGRTTVELWTSLGDEPANVERAAGVLPAQWPWRLVDVDESVADSWRVFARETWIADDLVVVPAWIELEPPDGVLAIRIEPGATFGLGDHPTTVLSLRAVRDLVFAGAAVLDVGCGSGVLAIAACRLGAGRAVAIDLSPAAVPTTRANAERNGVGRCVSVSTTPIGELGCRGDDLPDGQFDLIVANILAPALIGMSDDLGRLLSPSGSLVISGVLADRYEHVVDALAPLRVIETRTLDGWAAVTLGW